MDELHNLINTIATVPGLPYYADVTDHRVALETYTEEKHLTQWMLHHYPEQETETRKKDLTDRLHFKPLSRTKRPREDRNENLTHVDGADSESGLPDPTRVVSDFMKPLSLLIESTSDGQRKKNQEMREALVNLNSVNSSNTVAKIYQCLAHNWRVDNFAAKQTIINALTSLSEAYSVPSNLNQSAMEEYIAARVNLIQKIDTQFSIIADRNTRIINKQPGIDWTASADWTLINQEIISFYLKSRIHAASIHRIQREVNILYTTTVGTHNAWENAFWQKVYDGVLAKFIKTDSGNDTPLGHNNYNYNTNYNSDSNYNTNHNNHSGNSSDYNTQRQRNKHRPDNTNTKKGGFHGSGKKNKNRSNSNYNNNNNNNSNGQNGPKNGSGNGSQRNTNEIST